MQEAISIYGDSLGWPLSDENTGWGTDGICHITYLWVSVSLSVKQEWERHTWIDSCEGYLGWHMLPLSPHPVAFPAPNQGCTQLGLKLGLPVTTHSPPPSFYFPKSLKYLPRSPPLEPASKFCNDQGSISGLLNNTLCLLPSHRCHPHWVRRTHRPPSPASLPWHDITTSRRQDSAFPNCVSCSKYSFKRPFWSLGRNVPKY